MRALNNSGLVIGSAPLPEHYTVGDVLEQFDVHHESEVSQYMVTPGETYTPTEIHEPSKEEIDLFFNAPEIVD